MKQRMQARIRNIMLTIFITLWVMGNVVVIIEPLRRTTAAEERPDNFYTGLMEALGGIDKFYHPYYYSQLEDDFLSVVTELPEEDTLYVLVHEENPEIDPLEYYKRFWRVWAYPRPVIYLEEPIAENLERIPEGEAIIVLNLEALPDRVCISKAGAFVLCR